MGGSSEGKLRITDRKTLEFFCTLSPENNGGFVSVRTKARQLGIEQGDAVVIKVRSDGREYLLNLDLDKPLIAFSYRATVLIKRDEWIEVRIPLDTFEATSFGRPMKEHWLLVRRRSTPLASCSVTRRLGRSGCRSSRSGKSGRGFHDDMFPQDTDNGKDWSFPAEVLREKRADRLLSGTAFQELLKPGKLQCINR